MTMLVLGVDPGARRTGIVVADITARHALVTDASVDRPDDGLRLPQPSPAYLRAVVDRLDELCSAHPIGLVAVEGVVAPNPHMNRTNGRAVTSVEPLITTAAVMGAVLAWACAEGLPPVVVVRPGKNGSRPLGAYPDALVTDAERRSVEGKPWQLRTAGKGGLKDARSAWDVALAGPQALQVARHLPGGVYAYRT